ncbi:hypothetical protein KDN32_17225 [Nocardioides sp. J2M5]|uniref:hypothetical protein n=1 Tax=Nocardioides palaemonis TaxID=2829810 RepID=UPI001BA9FE6F|nr:hypothetical protein [Nocardioides palaemonis]MBS2939486.1 hypothetical protein [Nocardioides palaemonis]
MPLAKLAAPLALVGGLLWIVRALLGGGDDPLAGTLHFVGLACLLASAGAFGTTLVRSDALGMRVVVGLASALLVLSLIEAFRPAGARWYDAFWGAIAAMLGGVALLRRRDRDTGSPRSGAHAR